MEEITKLVQLIDYNLDSINRRSLLEMHKIVKSLYKNAFKCENPTIMNEWTENVDQIIELLGLIDDFGSDDTESSRAEIMDLKAEIKTIRQKQNVLLDRIVFKPPQPQETLIRYNNFINTEGLRYKPLPSANRMIIKKLFR